jgi:hypothetical protein
VHPLHHADWSLVEQMKRIGLVAGATYADLDPNVRRRLDGAPVALRPEGGGAAWQVEPSADAASLS